MSFHFSDPTAYYDNVQNIRFNELFNLDGSNTFYYIINWIYQFVWENTTVISFWIKINNVLITICAYLLLTKKCRKINYIDYLLLFNPYTIMTLVRNVRDVYIILFTVIIMLGMRVVKDNVLNKYWCLLGLGLLAITRSVLLIPFIWIYWEQHKYSFSKKARCILYSFIFILFIVIYQSLITLIANQMISAMVFVGEDTDLFLPLISGGITISIISVVCIRLFVGMVSFLFTPHPFNFIEKWLNNMTSTGAYDIYTGTDNLLISIGSIFSYLFIIPVIIAFFLNYKKINKYILIFVCCFIFMYVVSYLGVTDIRNRNTAIFFILIGVLFSDSDIKIKFLYYIYTLIIFVGILFVSV